MLQAADFTDYSKSFPKDIQIKMEALRAVIKKAAPKAAEVISYGMPAFKLNGMLVYFAAYEKHIGFYPTPSAIESFKKEISIYKSAKGSVQFPHDKPLPLKLVARMVKFRLAENMLKEKKKQ
ncbi:MAG: DUF1801 domain-containing protein [Chitinophagaceae bacterium]